MPPRCCQVARSPIISFCGSTFPVTVPSNAKEIEIEPLKAPEHRETKHSKEINLVKRRAIEMALRIPVLVRGSGLPDLDQLPSDTSALRTGFFIRDADWEYECESNHP
jgi:hypothetical protein